MIDEPEACLDEATGPAEGRRDEAAGPAEAREPRAGGLAAADRSLADALPQIIWVSDLEGRLVHLNRRWFEYTGQAPGERLDWSPSVHPDDLPAVQLLWARAHGAGEGCESHYRLRRADGAYRWFLGRVEPSRDEGGKIVRWVGTATDVDDRKRLEAERDALL
ncbi:MAG TPA: PAS domain-containing protein, partial [Polyangiaceae bacterium]|nr:PAS domain-containing protein [Polyangiaceae bacterium]